MTPAQAEARLVRNRAYAKVQRARYKATMIMLTPEQKAQLRAVCASSGLSMTAFVRETIALAYGALP